MLQPDLLFGISAPFWEENQAMKTNLLICFKRAALDDRNFWIGRQHAGAVKCISSYGFEVAACCMGRVFAGRISSQAILYKPFFLSAQMQEL